MNGLVVLPQSKEEEVRDKRAVRHPKSGARMFGSSLADVFSTPAYDCRVVGSDQKPEFAVTRLRSGPRKMEKAPTYPPDQAILICVSLTPAAIGQWRAVYNGRSVGVTRAIPFATTFINLSCRMEMWVRGPFDYLHYYLSRELLERIALDNAVPSLPQLREAFFVEDLVVAQMTKNILSPVKHGEPLIGWRSTRLPRCLAPTPCRRIAAPQSLRSRPDVAWNHGKSSEPRKCFARILREISPLRT